ncbi:Rrf2 family transcriptional regulator [Candidatus Fermentibacteria bacterium]|nr:Rrf2 family transcriptional regulator [Candidatus Fermentibacteria bacterium]
MSGLIKISDAASLGLHAAVLLATRRDSFVPTVRIAEDLRVSQAHLAKVLQWLARAGLVRSVRGPHGGFTLTRDPSAISLAQVFEAIEGPLSPSGCLLGRPACDGTTCIFGDVIARVEAELMRYLSTTTLAQFAGMRFSSD